MIIYTIKGNISKMPNFDIFFLFWNVKNVKVDLIMKQRTVKRTTCLKVSYNV